MNTTKKQLESTSEIKRQRTIFRNAILVTALLFIALLVGSGTTTNGQTSGLRDMLWGGLTIIAFGGMLLSQYVAYRQSDEYQRLVQLKAGSLAFMVILFATVVMQMLHALHLAELDKTIQIVIIGGILTWMTLLKLFEHRS